MPVARSVDRPVSIHPDRAAKRVADRLVQHEFGVSIQRRFHAVDDRQPGVVELRQFQKVRSEIVWLFWVLLEVILRCAHSKGDVDQLRGRVITSLSTDLPIRVA